MSVNRCQQCGANLALVGTIHRCVPKRQLQPRFDNQAEVPVLPVTEVKTGANYPGYRDKDKRRAYMREYMRKRRG